MHHFYLRRIGLGILYLCLSWTPLPWVLGFIECFFMPSRIREFNAVQAAVIATSLGIPFPAGWGYPVPGAYAPNVAYAQDYAQNQAQSHYVQTVYSPRSVSSRCRHSSGRASCCATPRLPPTAARPIRPAPASAAPAALRFRIS